MAPTVGPSSNISERFSTPKQDISGITQKRVSSAKAMQEQVSNIANTVLQLQAAARATANDALVTDFLNRYETKAQAAFNDLKGKTNLDAIDAVPKIHQFLEEEEQALTLQLQKRDEYVRRAFKERVQNIKNRYRNNVDAYGMEQTISYRDTMTENQLKMAADTVYQNFGTAMEEPSRQAAREIFLRQMDEKGIDPNSDIAKAEWQELFSDAHTSRVDVAIKLNQFDIATEAINLAYDKGEVSAQTRGENLAKIFIAKEAYAQEQLRKARAAAAEARAIASAKRAAESAARAREKHQAWLADRARAERERAEKAAIESFAPMTPAEKNAVAFRFRQDAEKEGMFDYIKDPTERDQAYDRYATRAVNDLELKKDAFERNRQQTTRGLAALASVGQGDSYDARIMDAVTRAKESGATEVAGMSLDSALAIVAEGQNLFGSREQLNTAVDLHFANEPVDTTARALDFTSIWLSQNGVPAYGNEIDYDKVYGAIEAEGFRNYDVSKVNKLVDKYANSQRQEQNAMVNSAREKQFFVDNSFAVFKRMVDSESFALPENWDDFFTTDPNGDKEKVRNTEALFMRVRDIFSAEIDPRYDLTPEQKRQAYDQRLGAYSAQEIFYDAMWQIMADRNQLLVDDINTYNTRRLGTSQNK